MGIFQISGGLWLLLLASWGSGTIAALYLVVRLQTRR
jgi:hypothetical protein